MENQNNITANRKEILSGVLFRERAEFIDPENKKILGFSARTKILGYETVAGAIKIDLKTTFRLVSRAEDGAFTHDIIESEQTETLSCDKIKPTTKICLSAVVVETKKTGNDYEATVEVSGWYLVENELIVLNSCLPGVCCKTTPLRAENTELLLPGGLTLTYTDESRMNVERLVDYCVKANVSNVFVNAGSYRVEGDIYIRIFAQSDDGQCFGQLFSHTFSTEIADERITSESDVDIDACVKNAELSLADGDKRLIISDVTLSFCGAISLPIETETISDAFSTAHEIKIKRSEEVITEGFCSRCIREKITGKFMPEGGVNELFGVLCPSVSASVTTNNGSYYLEGVLQADVLYQTNEDVAKGQTVELPFKLNLPLESKCDASIAAEISVTNASYKARGAEVELVFETVINVKGVSEKTICVVSDIEIGAAKEASDVAISLYIVRKGESLWDVAKALNAEEETLLRQNEDISLPLNGGEKVILYRELPFEQ